MSKQQTTMIQSPPTRIYTDTEVFREERDRIFATTWQFACHVEKLKNEGDFVTCRVAGENLLLVRENETTINAMYNVCAHRAARVADGEGCRKRFSCPYHAWTYNTRGELVSAPNAANVSGFDVTNYRLSRCRVEVVHGLVFVNLDDDAEPLRSQAPELVADLESYAPELPALTFVHRTEAHLKANWKVAIENYAECYHCELLHKELVRRVLDFESYSIEIIGMGQKHLSRPKATEDKAYDYEGPGLSEFVAWWLWPNFSFQNYPGGRVQIWTWTPVDVDHTHLTVDWYFPGRDMEDWERKLISHHASTTFAEDLDIIESVQQGLGSRGYEPGPLMIDVEKSQHSEHAVAAIQQFWRDAMGDNHA